MPYWNTELPERNINYSHWQAYACSSTVLSSVYIQCYTYNHHENQPRNSLILSLRSVSLCNCITYSVLASQNTNCAEQDWACFRIVIFCAQSIFMVNPSFYYGTYITWYWHHGTLVPDRMLRIARNQMIFTYWHAGCIRNAHLTACFSHTRSFWMFSPSSIIYGFTSEVILIQISEHKIELNKVIVYGDYR